MTFDLTKWVFKSKKEPDYSHKSSVVKIPGVNYTEKISPVV